MSVYLLFLHTPGKMSIYCNIPFSDLLYISIICSLNGVGLGRVSPIAAIDYFVNCLCFHFF